MLPAPSVGEVLGRAGERLRAAGVPTPGVDAELLLRYVSGWSRGELLSRRGEVLDSAVSAAFEALVGRRGGREPLQLIVGSVGFRYLDILVEPGVFIPRPETEVLAGLAIERTPTGGLVIEPCAGTGAIACAVASESAAGLVVATDASPAAVDLARRNAERCGARVDVRLGDLLEPVDPQLHGRVDVLVSNPPYVAAGEMDGLEPEVTAWDPHDALVAGLTGHETTDRLIAAATAWLRPGGWLALEVAESRARETADRCRGAGLVEAATAADLTGRARFVLARRP